MKMKQKLILVMMIVVLAQAACGTFDVSVQENAPTPVPTLEGACPTPTAETKLLTNSEDGYCLLYPAEYSTTIPKYIVINPISAPGDIPGEAWLNIATADAAGRTAAQIADEAIAAVGEGFNITRFEAVVDGEQAVVVDGLPGQDSARNVFIVHNGRLYNIIFMPWLPNATEPTALENLYTIAMDTLHFLP
ncbi:MAG TPA: hypothetical protein VNA23_07955 [Anaerolineales bacterium]|nr:hypothetical protein [Anaerolineales bacterium]